MNDLTLATHCSVPSGQYLGAIASTEVRPAPWYNEPPSPSATRAMASSQEEKSLVGHVGP